MLTIIAIKSRLINMLSDFTFVCVCSNDEGIAVCEYLVKYYHNALVNTSACM